MTKRVVVQVRVSEGDKSAWERWAADEGVSLSELIRRVMVERLAPVEVPGELERAVGVRAPKWPKVKLSKDEARLYAEQMGYKKTFKPDFK